MPNRSEADTKRDELLTDGIHTADNTGDELSTGGIHTAHNTTGDTLGINSMHERTHVLCQSAQHSYVIGSVL